ncbi:MAG: hypothetical protein LBV69_06905 [Bacteroidales bacterium]|jgi:hypothetical protein|nr:hypothetical protein [Bacteroidales bacterium]
MKTNIIIILILAIILTFSSCKKVDERIIGVWNCQTYTNLPQETTIFTFLENGHLVVKVNNINSANNPFIDTCRYSVIQTALKKQIDISESGEIPYFGSLNGKYKVYKYRNDILILHRLEFENGETAGSYKRLEMMRAD